MFNTDLLLATVSLENPSCTFTALKSLCHVNFQSRKKNKVGQPMLLNDIDMKCPFELWIFGNHSAQKNDSGVYQRVSTRAQGIAPNLSPQPDSICSSNVRAENLSIRHGL